MEVLDIDWKNIDSRFERDDFYEGIRAPKWLDFLAPEEPVDDDAWFCKPDCKHQKTAISVLKSPLVESHKVRQPRLVSSPSVSVSSTTPLAERTASVLNGKKTRGPLSASVTSLYELKAKESASGNPKKSSPLDRNKLQSATFKRHAHSENDNPNRPQSNSAVGNSGRNLKVQDKKSSISSPVKVSKQNIAAKGAQNPVSIEKKGAVKQTIHPTTTTTVTTPVNSEQKGVAKHAIHSFGAISSPETNSVESRKQEIHSFTTVSTPETTPVQSTKQAPNKALASDSESPSVKSGSALKDTFSSRTLFGKKTGKEFLSQLSEFCFELKKLALNGGQPDSTSTKHPNRSSKHARNACNPDNAKEAQDVNSKCSEFGGSSETSSPKCPSDTSSPKCPYTISTQNGSEHEKTTITSSTADPDKCTKSVLKETGTLWYRSKATAKICPKSNEQSKRTNDDEKKENVTSKEQGIYKKDNLRVHMEDIVRDTLEKVLTNLSAHDDQEEDALNSEKNENREDCSDSFLDSFSFSGPIHCQEYDIPMLSVDPELQRNEECSDNRKKPSKETHKKPLHTKIFNPSSWKKRKNDGMDQTADCAKKDKYKLYQKVQSCPPSPQKVSRLSQASSSSSLGKKSKITPIQPFRFRTMERGILREREYNKKIGRSCASSDNVFASPESKLYLSDVFWFLKRCALINECINCFFNKIQSRIVQLKAGMVVHQFL